MTADLSYDWIQARLLELSAGTLSPEDRARLELIAQADPFVADALEGYTQVADADHAGHLEQLRQRIASPKRARRRWLMPNLTVTAIAAIFMILIGTWAVVRWSAKPGVETREVILSPGPSETGPALSAPTMKAEVDYLAMPEVPRESFESWLRHQSRLPLEQDSLADAVIVALRFRVDSGGQPLEFQVDGEGIPGTYLEEAKRLVNSASPWRCPDGQYPCAGRVLLRFRK